MSALGVGPEPDRSTPFRSVFRDYAKGVTHANPGQRPGLIIPTRPALKGATSGSAAWTNPPCHILSGLASLCLGPTRHGPASVGQWCGSSSRACPFPSPPQTMRRASTTSGLPCKRNSRAPGFSTVPCPGATCSRRSLPVWLCAPSPRTYRLLICCPARPGLSATSPFAHPLPRHADPRRHHVSLGGQAKRPSWPSACGRRGLFYAQQVGAGRRGLTTQHARLPFLRYLRPI